MYILCSLLAGEGSKEDGTAPVPCRLPFPLHSVWSMSTFTRKSTPPSQVEALKRKRAKAAQALVAAVSEAVSSSGSNKKIKKDQFGTRFSENLRRRAQVSIPSPSSYRSSAPPTRKPTLVNDPAGWDPAQTGPLATYIGQIENANRRNLTTALLLRDMRLGDPRMFREARRDWGTSSKLRGAERSARLATYLTPRFSPWGALSDPVRGVNQRSSGSRR